MDKIRLHEVRGAGSDGVRLDGQFGNVADVLARVGGDLWRRRAQRGRALSPPQVYMVMGMRLEELCAPLDISDGLRLKIWTCFEHSLVHCTDFMVDRHLDQMLLCAIYVIARVGFFEGAFVDVVTMLVNIGG